MKFKTEKAKELYERILALREEKEEKYWRNRELFHKAEEISRSYAKKVYTGYICQGNWTGIDYQYGTPENYKKACEAFDKYLEDNNWESHIHIETVYNEKIAEARKAFNLEQYGYPTKKEYLEAKKNKVN